MTRRPTLPERIAFWIGWTLRGIPVLLLMACSAPVKVGECDLARDIKRVCAHQGRDCGTILCPGDTFTFPITAGAK